MRVAIVLSSLGLLAAGAAPAAADRGPTTSEKAAIARAVGVPARCQAIRVSTVDRTWAASTFRTTRSCAPYGTAGTDVVRRTKGRWAAFSGSSGCTRPWRVPRRVWKDLLPASCS